MDWAVRTFSELPDRSDDKRTLLYTLVRGDDERALYVVISPDADVTDDGRAAVEAYVGEEVPPKTIRIGPGNRVSPGWAGP
jgi:hypothetical protein